MSIMERVEVLAAQPGRVTRPAAALQPPAALSGLAELSQRLPRRHGDAIAVLLAAARPFDDGFAPLRPLWVQEALHRASSTLRLFEALSRRDRGRPSLRSIYERRLALHLAAELAALETTALHRLLPCSAPLRDVARDMVALFGPATGQVVIDTDVTPVSLAGYRCRALVLLGLELVTNALLHAFPGRDTGRITLRLSRIDGGRARLLVRDDGAGFGASQPVPGASVAGALADLLQGSLRYGRCKSGGAVAVLTMPVDHAGLPRIHDA